MANHFDTVLQETAGVFSDVFGEPVTYCARGWVSPDGYEDVDGWWSDEALAYDERGETYAYEVGYQPPGVIIYEFSAGVKASHWRIDCVGRDNNGNFYNPTLKVELYYSGGWHIVHPNGSMDTVTGLTQHEFFQDDTGGSGENEITRMRITPEYYESATRKLWIFQIGLKRYFSRAITAVVEREGLQAVDGLPSGRSVLLTVDVENDAETGISSDEIDTGGDEIGVPLRIGKAASQRTIAKIVAQDAGRMTLAVW